MGHVFNGTHIDPFQIPPSAIDAAKANLRRIEPEFIRKGSRARNKSDAKRLLESFIGKLSPSGIAIYAVTRSITDEEMSVWNCLINTMIVKPLFTGDRFFDELCAVLLENNLLARNEIEAVQSVKIGIVLMAISIMHRSNIVIDGSYSSHLMASSGYQGNIGINCVGLMPARPGKTPINMAIQLFDSNIPGAQICSDELQNEMFWEFPLEVTPDQTLRRRR
jgi:hypothetical protein